jgi:ankyrin repeat protein
MGSTDIIKPNDQSKVDQIFKLMKSQNFDKVFTMIKNKEIIDLDVRDINYNYFIHLIIIYNQYSLLELVLNLAKTNTLNVRLDILDTDGRSILYNCIKYNYIHTMKLLLEYNSINIGLNIYDIKDRLGLTALHYSVIFNNFESFKILLEYKADPYIISKEGSNVFVISLIYKRDQMLLYLLDRKYNITFTTGTGETLLQLATTYNNVPIINQLLKTNINLNNTSSDFGLSILHQSIIFNNYDLFVKLLDSHVNYNQSDFYGNTPLHYILIDGKINFLKKFMDLPKINFNSSNINGEIPLDILLSSIEKLDMIPEQILNRIVLESDLNFQNNQGVTCLMQIITKKLIDKFRPLLVLKPLNFFIESNSEHLIQMTDELVKILVDSYYNQIKIHKDELLLDWERWCSTDSFDKLKQIIKTESGDNSQSVCKKKISQIIRKEKRSIPRLSHIDIKFDNGIFVNNCQYTGSPIDILFGLLLLFDNFKNKGLNIVLDYPLTLNKNLENYYKRIGLNYPYKLDFSNIEIIWSYQKIFYPSYFDDKISLLLKSNGKYIVVPIGIETSTGSHANILFWDIQMKTLERFEPAGSNYPMGMNYNPDLLDNLIESRFTQYDPELKYYPPYKFLPPISFQILEGLETPKCKKIGDPNGFCGVWCIWWVYQRMLNITGISTHVVPLESISSILINRLKLDNQSFKSLIRNFSNKITELRDKKLKKYNLDINDWIVGNYSSDILDKLDQDIFSQL